MRSKNFDRLLATSNLFGVIATPSLVLRATPAEERHLLKLRTGSSTHALDLLASFRRIRYVGQVLTLDGTYTPPEHQSRHLPPQERSLLVLRSNVTIYLPRRAYETVTCRHPDAVAVPTLVPQHYQRQPVLFLSGGEWVATVMPVAPETLVYPDAPQSGRTRLSPTAYTHIQRRLLSCLRKS